MESTCTAAEWSCSGASGTSGGAFEAALEQDEAVLRALQVRLAAA